MYFCIHICEGACRHVGRIARFMYIFHVYHRTYSNFMKHELNNRGKEGVEKKEFHRHIVD